MAGQLPESEAIREAELFEGVPEAKPGEKRKTRQQLGLPPINKIYLNPERLKKVKLTWYIDIDTKEKETSNIEKIMFREELADIALLMNMGARPNMETLQSQHALVWNRRKEKMFEKPISQQEMMAAAQGGADTSVPVPNGAAPSTIPVG